MVARFLTLFVAVAFVSACAQPFAPDVEPLASVAKEPFIHGTITDHDPEWGFLVEAESTESGEVEAAWVRSDHDTRIKQSGQGGVRWETLSVGQTVSVWISGPVMESLPVKVVAETIVVE